MIALAFWLLGLATIAFGYRAIAGPTLPDRMIGVNGMIIAGMAVVVVHAVHTANGAFLPVLVVAGLVSFVGTGMIARFLEGHGR